MCIDRKDQLSTTQVTDAEFENIAKQLQDEFSPI